MNRITDEEVVRSRFINKNSFATCPPKIRSEKNCVPELCIFLLDIKKKTNTITFSTSNIYNLRTNQQSKRLSVSSKLACKWNHPPASLIKTTETSPSFLHCLHWQRQSRNRLICIAERLLHFVATRQHLVRTLRHFSWAIVDSNHVKLSLFIRFLQLIFSLKFLCEGWKLIEDFCLFSIVKFAVVLLKLIKCILAPTCIIMLFSNVHVRVLQ